MKKLVSVALTLFAVGTLYATPQYRAKLTVSGYTLENTLTNFPVLVRISEERISGFKYADCAENGSDLSFTLPDGTPLPHEVDTWNTAGDSIVWVSLTNFCNGTTFYVRWKDATPPASQSTLVWSRANFIGVWHLNETGGDALDSSGNGYTGTNMGSNASSCDTAFGKGRQMGSSYFKMGAVPKDVFSKAFSLTVWARVTDNSGTWFTDKNAQSDDGFYVKGNGLYNTAEFYPYGNGDKTTVKALTRWQSEMYDNWQPYELSYTGSSLSILCFTSGAGITTPISPTQDGFSFGSSMNGTTTYLRKNKVDEIRLRTVVPTTAWRYAEYQQVKTDAFLACGAAETIGECIVVRSASTAFAQDNLPAYGIHPATAGERYTFTAPATAPWQNGAIEATCTGWELRKTSDGSLVRTSANPNAGENVTTCVVDYAEPVVLTWSWSTAIGSGRITYYVSKTGSRADGLSWETAFWHPQDAIDAAPGIESSPATIILSNGTYSARTPATHVHTAARIEKSYIELTSVNGPAVTKLDGTQSDTYDGTYAFRPLAVTSGLTDVFVHDLALVNGKKKEDAFTDWWQAATSLAASSGTFSNLVITVYSRNRCNPVYIGGTAKLLDSVIEPASTTHNNDYPTAYNNHFVRLAGSATIDGCIIRNVGIISSKTPQGLIQPVTICSATATLRNTLITGCTMGPEGCAMSNGGGAVYATAGTIENCTVTKNHCNGGTGGIRVEGNVTIRNCIVWGNTSSGSYADITTASGYTPSITYTCSSAVSTGTDGNLNANPEMKDDFTLPITSLAAGAGLVQDWMTDAHDLARNPRVWTDGTVSMGAYEPQGRYKGMTGDFSIEPAFSDFGTAPFKIGFAPSIKGASGNETYSWDFGDGQTSADKVATNTFSKVGLFTVTLTVSDDGKDPLVITKKDLVTSVGATCYVKEGNAGTKPYDTWEKATSNIDEAVALKPANIVVTNGTYLLGSVNGLVLNWAVNMRSVEGAEKTVLDTGLRTRTGAGAITIRRVLTMGHKDAVVDGFSLFYTINTGLTSSGGTLKNCHFAHYLGQHHNPAITASNTTIEDCVFDFSHLSWEDANGRSTSGGLILYGKSVVDRCVITNFYCVTTTGNAFDGRGAVRLEGQSALRNSLVAENEYKIYDRITGGGIVIAGTSNEVANCTIVGNKAVNSYGGTAKGGGIYNAGSHAFICNNILWTNMVNGVHTNYEAATVPDLFTGNLVGVDPLFATGSKGYELQPDSPCVNGGVRRDWCRRKGRATDLDGQERVRGGRPDIGCWELQRDIGMMLIVR